MEGTRKAKEVYTAAAAAVGARIASDRHLVTFPSVAALGEFAKATGTARSESNGMGWDRGQSGTAVLPLCNTGDPMGLDEARALMAQMSQPIMTTGRKRVSGVAGSSVCVPDYLANSPTPMRRIVRDRKQGSPVRIFCDTTLSAALSHEDIRKKGCAVLALALALHAKRPVELYVLQGLNAPQDAWGTVGIVATRVPLANVSLSIASLALCNAALTRNVGYEVLQQVFNCGGSWHKFTGCERTSQSSPEFAAKMREFLGLRGDDLFVPPMHRDDVIVRDSLGWIKANMAKLQREGG